MTINPAMARILAKKLSTLYQSDDFYGIGICAVCGEFSGDYLDPYLSQGTCSHCGDSAVYGAYALVLDLESQYPDLKLPRVPHFA